MAGVGRFCGSRGNHERRAKKRDTVGLLPTSSRDIARRVTAVSNMDMFREVRCVSRLWDIYASVGGEIHPQLLEHIQMYVQVKKNAVGRPRVAYSSGHMHPQLDGDRGSRG